MSGYFLIVCMGLALIELIKGSERKRHAAGFAALFLANGSGAFHVVEYPGVQDHVRSAVLIAWMFMMIPAETRMHVVPGGIAIGALWGFIYWLFNRYWVGRFKFLPITQKRFEGAAGNTVGMKEQILGISHGGEHKAFPVNMLYYHHQIADEVGGHPVWPTYCGLCNSGRIYDRLVDGKALEFTLWWALSITTPPFGIIQLAAGGGRKWVTPSRDH